MLTKCKPQGIEIQSQIFNLFIFRLKLACQPVRPDLKGKLNDGRGLFGEQGMRTRRPPCIILLASAIHL